MTLRVISLGSLTRMMFFDPSGGGTHAKSVNALVGAGMDVDSNIYSLEVWGKNCGLGESIHQWQLFHDRFKFHINRYEAVGAYKGIGDLIREAEMHTSCPRCHKVHLKLHAQPTLPISGARAVMSKNERIRVFVQKKLEDRRIYLQLPKHLALRNQIASFGVNLQIDELDAFAYCCYYLRPPTSFDDLETAKADLALRRAMQTSRIETEHNYGGYC